MQRLDFIRASQTGTEPFSTLCRRFGISRKTGYKWLQRFNPDDPASLFDQPRTRLTHPERLPPGIVQQLIDVRVKHPYWGPKKVRAWLINHQVPFDVPAASTIGDTLKREGLVIPRTHRRRTPGNRQPLTTISEVNQVWSADFKGKFRLLSQQYCHPFTLTDNHSRYLLSCEGTFRESESFVRGCLERAFLEYGLPEVLKTDNGQPFAGTGIAGLSRLAVWLIKLGIRPERIRKGHPEENGRHERMHRSLKHSLSFGNRRASLEAQQTWFDSYRREFNQERPHEALGGLTPGGIWVPSPRRWDGKTPEVSYPEGARLYRVRTKGDIYIGKRLFLNQALRGEYVMLEERDDGLEAIIFNQMDLAYYDRRKQSIIRID
ncbi:integrase core domain-containing protein [Buttiauxella ferragutiae]|uniref:integrase core domain-containing protein n=2 Tax=Buttiauxella ferragutiae TaxID=82989 RepID=UPI001F53366C|nr:integrase core domain-containing protein [Buttiauxella ferragutiae]UNK60169.1 integrase core domain-containing protein [Buttiauxella ferragutiae]